MKFYTNRIHVIVRNFNLEKVFFLLSKLHPFFLKFIPLHHEYPQRKRRLVKRLGVWFDLELSDYMQWHVYAMQADNSWKKAMTSLENDAVVLDIGANCGAFSLPLANQVVKKAYKGIQLHAFEPNPVIFNKLQTNLKLNIPLNQVVYPHQLGLGNEEGEFGMTFDRSNSGHGKVISDTVNVDNKVRLSTVDNFVKEYQIEKVNFIKIDVEGFEPLVLKGAEYTIKAHRPYLFIEVTEKWYLEKNYSQINLFKQLEELGYSYFAEEGDSFVKIERSDQVYSDQQFNLWATYGK